MGEDWRMQRVSSISALTKEAEPDVIEERKWREPSNPDGVPVFFAFETHRVAVSEDPDAEGR